MKLKTSLLKHCKNESEETALRQQYASANFLRKILAEKLENDVRASQRICMTQERDHANYSAEMAYQMGLQKALSDVIAIISQKD